MVMDTDTISRRGDGVVGPCCEAGSPHCCQHDGGGAIAETELAGLAGEEEVAYHAEIPLGDGHV